MTSCFSYRRLLVVLAGLLAAAIIGTTASPVVAAPPGPDLLPPILSPEEVARLRSWAPSMDAAFCEPSRQNGRFRLGVRGNGDIRDNGLRLQVWTSWAGWFESRAYPIDGVTSYIAGYAAIPRPGGTGLMMFRMVNGHGLISDPWYVTVDESGDCDRVG